MGEIIKIYMDSLVRLQVFKSLLHFARTEQTEMLPEECDLGKAKMQNSDHQARVQRDGLGPLSKGAQIKDTFLHLFG